MANAALLLPAGSYQVQEILSQEAAVTWALAQYRFVAYKKYDLQPRVLVLKEEDLSDIVALAQVFISRA